MAGIGGFVAAEEDVVNYLMCNLRSQIYAKSLPMPMVVGSLKRLELIKTRPELRENLWKVVNALQKGLRDAGMDIGNTESPVTPVFLKGTPQQGANVAFDLRENYGVFCSLVIYPVVPKDVIMLRIIPTSVHTIEDVEYTVKCFKEIREKLEKGVYASDHIQLVK
jgi:glycine C-acetyltransferase